ncbi:efflux RND transporter permease subunit [Alteromonas sp. 5E99-2]|uniref:efflux RND transporter permease subunit n=1 Tax=Alteromonas sp. 5E99-2 TaxID=2817683 RepID=UPI001A99EDD8|nr:efflux RND transporter permease subunit [Alteromonas sp. 5E99-2]MBO1256676.1 efflux RND transporter permease subunit [Alteromonas sp. 5E99-2]
MQNNKNPIEWFIDNPIAANLLLIGVIIVGLFSLGDIRKEAFPSLEPDSLTISINFDSGDPLQAEEGITIKVENAIEMIPGIKRITSISNSRGSRITVLKTSDYELDTLLVDVKTKIDAIFNFPEDAERPIIEKVRQLEHAIWVQLYGDVDHAVLQSLSEKLLDDLKRKPAIKDLAIQAKPDPMISIEVDEARLQAYGLELSDIADTINLTSTTAQTTSLRNKEKSVRLKVAVQAYSAEEFSNIPLVTSSDGTRITLGDVATVTETFEEDVFVLSRYNQKNAAAIQILVDENSDIVDIAEQTNEIIEKWDSLLPHNVSIDSWHDQSVLIKERISLLVTNAMTGMALVFIVLAIFLNIRVAFWVAAGLPFIFFGTVYLMTDRFFGLTINELTTLGFIMALGIVVDDAVVIGESIYTTRRENGDTRQNTIAGTTKVASATLFGVLTTLVAFIGLSNIDGYGGQIYAQFGTVVVICLLLSIVESKLILPSHLAKLKTDRKASPFWWSHIQNAANNGLTTLNKRLYEPLIWKVLAWRYAIVITFVVVFSFSVGMLITGTVKVAFFPEIYGDTVEAKIKMYDDASYGQLYQNLTTSEQVALDVDAQYQQDAGINASGIGSIQVIATSDHEASLRIELNDSATYTISDFAHTWEKSIGQLEAVKKLQIVSTLELLDNFKIVLKAQDSDTLKSAGDEILAYLHDIDDLSGIDHNLEVGAPLYKFTLTEQGQALGFDTSSLAQQVLTSFGGAIVQRFQRENNEVNVRVRYPLNHRQTLSDIENTNVRTEQGFVVPLMSVASIETRYQKEEISRIDGVRSAFISASVNKNNLSPNQVVNDLKENLLGSLLAKYPELSVTFAGEEEQQSETTHSLTHTFILTMLVIYSLLAIPLKSYIQPLIIMMIIPFGVIGAIWGHWANGLTLSILSLNGIFALSGVVVNDGILLVSTYNNLRKTAHQPPKTAIVNACTSRLRAVLLTSVTTFVGLLPLLSETSLQAQFLIPAAASLGYGILFATVITLVLMPAMLMIKQDITFFNTSIIRSVCAVISR